MGWNAYYDAPLLQQLLNAAGIPPIDKMALIENDGRVVPDGTGGFVLPVLNVSAYQTLVMVLQAYGNYQGLAENTVTLAWYTDPAATDQVASDVITFPACGPAGTGPVVSSFPNCRATIEPRAPYLQITYSLPTYGGAGPAHICATRAYGSYRTNTRRAWTYDFGTRPPTAPNYLVNTDNLISPVAATYHGSAAGGTVNVGYPRITIPGRVLIDYLFDPITTASYLTVNSFTGARLATALLPVNTAQTTGTLEFYADRAIQINFGNNSAGAVAYDVNVGFDAWQ